MVITEPRAGLSSDGWKIFDHGYILLRKLSFEDKI